jgi:adenosylcobinamide-GDP ribazoletransferase
MRSFLAALQFLTILPVRFKDHKNDDASNSLIFFPFIGFLLGGISWLVLSLCLRLDLGIIADAILPIVALAAFTGGLHLDGLCDTADAFLSGKDKDGMLAIMRDPHCGALGTTAMVCSLLLKIAFFAAIPLAFRGKALWLACIAARWPLVLSLYLFPYARQQGKATPFIQGLNGSILLTAAALAGLCSLIAGWKGLIVVAASSLFVIAFDIRVTRKLGGITGDTLGASVELAEVFSLLFLAFAFLR